MDLKFVVYNLLLLPSLLKKNVPADTPDAGFPALEREVWGHDLVEYQWSEAVDTGSLKILAIQQLRILHRIVSAEDYDDLGLPDLNTP